MKTINYLLTLSLLFAFACSSGSKNESSSEESNASTKATEEAASTAEEVMGEDIVELAVGTESLSTLATALTAGDLITALKAAGPFTVFAPTNEAFSALPDGTLEDLLKPENKDQLVNILTYHVVSGKVMSTDLVDGMEAETLNGAVVKISLSNGAQVNGVNITSADIEASNGVVHVIDAVLIPTSTEE